jgi:hypothetical protein
MAVRALARRQRALRRFFTCPSGGIKAVLKRISDWGGYG